MENCRVVPDARSCTTRVPKIPSARSVPGTMPRSLGLEQFSFAGCQVVSHKRLFLKSASRSGPGRSGSGQATIPIFRESRLDKTVLTLRRRPGKPIDPSW